MSPTGQRTGIERTVLHHGRRFDFEIVRETVAGAEPIVREVVRHPGAVVVLAITEDNQIALIRNWRIALEDWVWELPAGTMEPPEPAERCAARELEEEVGLRAARVTPIAEFFTTPGMTDERMHAFLATGLTHVGQRLEYDERIEIHMTPVQEAFAMIDDGRLMDAKSVLTILLALRTGALPG